MDKNKELIQSILNEKNFLYNRIEAINDIDLLAEKRDTLITQLTGMLNREKRKTPHNTVDWDPAGEERVVDIHIIKRLNELHHTTENNRIPILVSQALSFMKGIGDERKEDADVIRLINNKEILSDIIKLTKTNDPVVIENAVIVLNNLNLADAPVGGDVSSILSAKTMKFTFSHLKEEMELYVKAANGRIILSDSVQHFIKTNNMQRAGDNEQVTIENSLIGVVERGFTDLFDYYMENKKVIVCTHAEAAKRWQNWYMKQPH